MLFYFCSVNVVSVIMMLLLWIDYLAMGASQKHLSFLFSAGLRTVGKIIRDICRAL